MPPPYCYEHPRPAVTVDLVVFTLLEKSLRVLLIRRGRAPFEGAWAIPGGFLEIDEPIEDAARRELLEEAGLRIHGPVAFIGVFGKPGRDPRGRTITIAFAASIRPGEHEIKAGDDAAEARWLEVTGPLNLAFDHGEILDRAKEWLRRELLESSIGLDLLSRSFELGEVDALFRDLGLSIRQARAWLKKMQGRGRVQPEVQTKRRYKQTSAES